MYSNSRLQTFEQCPRKYKFRYVDKLRTTTEGIEAFVGKRVHEALEKLYRDLKFTKLNSLEDVLQFYEDAWEKNWHGEVHVVRPAITPGHFFELGRQCITTYYKRYHPFNQSKTLGLEERIEMTLSDGKREYAVLGFIDRLAWVPETETYEIHDYKTGSAVPTQAEVDEDRQLALYHLGILQRWPDAKHVKLVWHYLAADKELSSTRSTGDLKTLEAEVIDAIHQIENEGIKGRWEARTSALCGWCDYKPICPAFKHPLAMEALEPNAYLQDSGVQLVQRYAELDLQKADHLAQMKSIDDEQKKVQEAAIAYAEKEGLQVLDGPNHKLIVKTDEDWKAPRKTDDPFAWELLRTTLKNAGKLEDVSTVNGAMLKYAVRRNKWPEALVKSIVGLVQTGLKKTVTLVKKS